MIDIFVFIRDINESVTEDFVLSKAISLGNGVKEIIKDPQIWENSSVPSDSTIQKMVNETVKGQAAKIRNYKKWVLGYGLILYCAIFDDFLITLLDDILTLNPQFTSWISKNDILSKFRESTIKAKYKTLISRLGFTEEELFDFSIFIPRIRTKFNDVNLKTLIGIYKKRNQAAHSSSYVIGTLDELSNIKELFEKFIWNLAIKSKRKFNTKIDIYPMADRI